MGNATNAALTDYVATRWYRAPEILLGSTTYSTGVDMWSVGCILGELLTGQAIFPGKSTVNQLELVMEVTGCPSQEDMEVIKSPFAATILESLPVSQPRQLEDMFPTVDEEALDLMRHCLLFNPGQRSCAKESLCQVFVSQFATEEDLLDCGSIIRIPLDDNTKLTAQDYRERLYDDVQKKKREQRRLQRKKLELQQPRHYQQHVSYSMSSTSGHPSVSNAHQIQQLSSSPTAGVSEGHLKLSRGQVSVPSAYPDVGAYERGSQHQYYQANVQYGHHDHRQRRAHSQP